MKQDSLAAGKTLLLDEILSKRSNPAVIIMDRRDRLLYFNQEAQEFLQQNRNEPLGRAIIPHEISDLCERLKNHELSDLRNSGLIRDINGRSHVAVAHFIRPSNEQEELNFIVVIQPVAESHIDLKRFKEQYGLTPRETEVLGLVCAGFSNREISVKLFISEYTTGDHLKNIMRKTGVSSRAKLMALVI
jgi:DNA-binding CsgD family transcriptional regulator